MQKQENGIQRCAVQYDVLYSVQEREQTCKNVTYKTNYMKFDMAMNIDGKVKMFDELTLLECITILLLMKRKGSKQIAITISTSEEDANTNG